MPRFSRLLSCLLALVLAVSCQDDQALLPSDPGPLGLAGKGVCPAEDLIEDLFPKGLANAATQQCRNIQRQFDRGEVEDAYEKLTDLTAFIQQHLENGRLRDPDGLGPETAASGAAQLFVALNMIVELASSGDEIPAEAFTSEGGIVQTVDAEEAWDIETRDGYAGITKAAGVPVFLNGVPYDGPVTVFIAPIDPSESSFPSFGLEIGGPDRAAFPVFKDMGTIPDGLQFGDGNIDETPDPTNELVAELCIVDPPHPLAPFPGQIPDLRVGHITEGEVVDTPLRDSTLDCIGVNDEVPTMALFENRWHRWANAALGPALQLFDVAKLHAEPGRLGGAISSFSEFGGVDKTRLSGGTTAYVANLGSNNISAVDLATGTVATTIPVPGAFGIAISPDGSTAYVTNLTDVSVINLQTNQVTESINVGSLPWGVAITPDGSTVLVTNRGSGTVSVINSTTNSVTGTIGVAGNAYWIAITPDGTTAYVTSFGSDLLSIIDVTTQTLARVTSVGSFLRRPAFTPDGSRALITDSAGVLHVIDVGLHSLTTSIPIPDGPYAVAVTPDGTTALVSSLASDYVSLVDLGTETVRTTITVGLAPYSIGTTPDGIRAVVVNNGSDDVSVIDLPTRTVTMTIGVGDNPRDLAIVP